MFSFLSSASPFAALPIAEPIDPQDFETLDPSSASAEQRDHDATVDNLDAFATNANEAPSDDRDERSQYTEIATALRGVAELSQGRDETGGAASSNDARAP
jgi:hypothetical protein